jgi:hypothetical protein
MAEAHLEIEIGAAKFTAEGSATWVDAKYDAFISQLKEVGSLVIRSSHEKAPSQKKVGDVVQDVGPLAIFLKERNVGANQNKRFLATAVWLKRQGRTILQTAEVAKALSDAQQQRLGNPADILNQNVKKGFCVKTGDGFYVTPEGEESLAQS